MIESIVEKFDLVRVFEGACGGCKAGAMLRKISFGLSLIPFMVHKPLLPDTGSSVKTGES
jgi:hypothetical protein